MRKEAELSALLRALADLLADEAARNSKFAARLDSLLSGLTTTARTAPAARPPAHAPEPVPDIHAEWMARGEEGFRLWLRDVPVPVLRAVIRAQDFDPTRRTAKWIDASKLATFIADNLRARLARGSAFLDREPDA